MQKYRKGNNGERRINKRELISKIILDITIEEQVEAKI